MKVKEKFQNAKQYVQAHQRKVILIMCCVVIFGGLVAGTLAWLVSMSGPVVNSFIGSNLEIDLAEEANNFQMIPHLEIAKDPKVTVKANSEACWLFLQVKESAAQANGSGITVKQGDANVTRNGSDYKYLDYQVIAGTDEFNGWTLMTEQQVTAAGFPKTDNDGSVNTYYYRKVGADGTALDADQTFDILVDNQVTVEDYIINQELTVSQLTANPVKITFTPVAVQRLGFDFTGAGQEICNQFVVE